MTYYTSRSTGSLRWKLCSKNLFGCGLAWETKIELKVIKILSMKDYANSRLKLKRTVIWTFCLHKFGWYLKVKVGFRKAKTLFTEGKGFFAFFSDQAMFDLWSLVDHRRGDSTPHSSRQRKRSRIVYFFNRAHTSNSFFLSSSTASALKPTVCESDITFLFNRAFSSCDQNRFAIDKAGQLVTGIPVVAQS